MLPIESLRVDAGFHGYQRPKIKDARIADMARNYSTEACAPVTVGRRSDGSYWVVDGQQRVETMKKLGAKEIDCKVFKSNGRPHEALIFLKINATSTPQLRGVGRTRMTGYDIYRAGTAARVAPYREITSFLNARGYKVAQFGNKSVAFPRMLVSLWARNKDAARRAFDLHSEIASHEDGKLNDHIFRGLWWLFSNGIDASLYADKFIKSGGCVGLIGAIRRRSIMLNRGVGEMICGEALLGIINKGLRNKVKTAFDIESEKPNEDNAQDGKNQL
jgi:hypothetical protein